MYKRTDFFRWAKGMEKTIQNIKNKTYNLQNISGELELERLNIEAPVVQSIVLEEKGFFFPVEWSNLEEHIYFSSAYQKTKAIAAKIIQRYPIGRAGNIVGSWDALDGVSISAAITSGDSSIVSSIQQRIEAVPVWKEDVEESLFFYNNLTFYEQWVLNQLAGATTFFNVENSLTALQTYKQPTFTITGYYVSATSSLTGSVSSIPEDKRVVLPVILRDTNNNLLPPFGSPYNNSMGYHDNLVGGYGLSPSVPDASFYEMIMTTALAFDEGIHFALTNRGGTGSHEFIWNNYDGVQQNEIFPNADKFNVFRPAQLAKLVPPHALSDDEDQVLNRFLELLASVLDDSKLYMDNLTNMFKNYWSNWKKIPRGLVQKMVAFQLGSELFSSSNNGISDAVLRGKRSVSDITYEFWNRVLCTMVYAYKTKGTLESIKSMVRAYGFPESMMEVRELCNKYSSFDRYTYDVQGTHVARFGNTVSSDLFAISANTGYIFNQNSLTAGDQNLTVSFRFREVLNVSNTGSWRTIYTNTPSISALDGSMFSLQMKTQYDPTNANNVYNEFAINANNVSVTTNHEFWKALNSNKDDFISVAIALLNNSTESRVSVYLGKIKDTIYYSDPVVVSLTASIPVSGTPSLTSFSQTYCSGETYSSSAFNTDLSNFVIGDISNPPSVYLQEFLIDRQYINEEEFATRVNNFENFSNTSFDSISSILVHYKLRENVDYSIVGQDYIIDSSLNGVTGVPVTNAVTMVQPPYQFFDDLFKAIKYRDVGFNLPITERIGDLTSEDIKRKNLRIGMSVAKPINEDIENYLGDVEVSDLMFDPVEYFNEVSNYNNFEYSQLEAKRREIFERYFETFKPWKYTTFIERIEGHLASFFNFIKQFVPIKERVVSKGVIYEDYTLSRTRLRKPWISTPLDIVLSVIQDVDIDIVSQIVRNPLIAFDLSPVDTVVAQLNSILSLTGSPVLSSIILDPSDTSFGFDMSPQMMTGVAPKFDAPIPNIIFGSAKTILPVVAEPVLTKVTGHGGGNFPVVSESVDAFRIMLNDMSNFFLAPSTYNVGVRGKYSMDISFDKNNIFLATAYTEDDVLKILEGRILISNSDYKTISRFQYPNVPVVRVNTTNCKNSGGINRLKMVFNGIELDRNGEDYSIPYLAKGGIPFRITTIGSISEGLPINQEVKIEFHNLINPNDDVIDLTFYIGFDMREFSNTQGYSLTTNLDTT